MSSRGIARRMMATSYFFQLERVFCERHPYCQQCIKSGIITPARYVIHRQPLKEHSRPEDQRRAIYDPANFIAVCRDHWKQHEADEIRREAEGAYLTAVDYDTDTDELPRYQQPDDTDELPRYQHNDDADESPRYQHNDDADESPRYQHNDHTHDDFIIFE